ncbi:sensor histidine kinase [Pseudomonas sp. NPDC086251]|uniref:sensor histidine kinase n=1 Tax=Pseudomonas sp. NPDC086251 TaxID=3364431 RepID=UPI00383294D4
MRLADFIQQNMEPVLQQWKDFAKSLTPAAEGMDALALRNHAEQMLRTIAADLQPPQSPEARILKSHGNAPRSDSITSAESHADLRHASGFTIGQVIANLIGNAIQHGEADAPITVTLKAVDGFAMLSVHNAGLPIEESAKPSFFNPLSRHLQGGVEYGAEAGLGLGLYIASAIVSAHHGNIEVESEADSGTTFTVRLPSIVT